MRVAIVIPSLAKGGAERIAIDTCRHLNLIPEVEARLFVLSSIHQFEHLTTDVPVTLCPITYQPSLTSKDNIDVSSFYEPVRAFAPDVIHSHLFLADVVARLELLDRVSYFSHVHGVVVQFERFKWSQIGIKKMWTDLYERFGMKRRYTQCHNHFIAVSDYYKQYLKATLGVADGDITMLHNAIDLARFTPNGDKKAPTTKTIKLVSVGSLIPVKGHELLLEVVGELRQRGYDPQLTLVGDGSEYERLSMRANTLGIGTHVHFAKHVHDVETYLRDADIYVHSALRESFGLVLIEAMACGTPVVTTDAGGNRELIRDGQNGYILPIRSVSAYCDRIITLATMPEIYTQIRTAAIEYAGNFSMDEYASKLVTLYRQKLRWR
jgi:glycosyltransferase involved in cell wall biosynthesis